MSRLPRTYAPQLATLVKDPPEGDQWVHEMKYDGYRIGCRVDGDTVTLLSRNGKDWTEAFPEIVAAARRLRVRQALLDGEVAMLMPDGRTSFQALQNVFSAGGNRRGLVYFVFDVLHLDGEDLTKRPLDERKARLGSIRGITARSRIRLSEHIPIKGRGHSAREIFAQACRLGAEGIISKRVDAPYRAGRRPEWVKTKCVQRQEFVIGGFTDPEGSRKGIGSVLVGYYQGERLVFAGKVGTGFTHRSALDLRRALEEIEVRESPFDPPPRGWLGRHAHWVRPRLVAEAVFTEWTQDGKIRHPSFQGLRRDKNARDITRERPRESHAGGARASAGGPTAHADGPKAGGPRSRVLRSAGTLHAGAGRGPKGRVTVAGVSLSHPDRVLFPEIGMTKLGLAKYYESIAHWILPHLADRPLTLVRCPEGAGGECFYMKHSKVWAPEHVRRVRIREKTKTGDYLIVDTLPALIGLVQMGILEIHTWNSRFAQVEQPDRMVFDIDPGPRVEWRQVVESARLVRQVLETLDLGSVVKTTGGRGLHVVVPLRPERGWSECLAFSRALSERIVDEHPDRYTTTFAKEGRESKILIDYLRNNRTNTSVAAFSTRRRPNAPVSVPLAWSELDPDVPPDRFTVLTVPPRLARRRRDPWAGYRRGAQRIPPRVFDAVVGRSR